MTAVLSFCGLCLLLIAGKAIRVALPIFQRLYLPSAMIGGALGLILLSTLGKYIPESWHANWGSLPGFLINVVFAALFIGKKIPGIKQVWQEAAPQFCMGQMLAWGQYVVGLSVTFFILIPLFKVNPAFGNLLEIGFEGGHGTVAGLSQTFIDFKWEAGRDLGFTVATIGMVLGIVIGMMLVNLAIRRKWVSEVRPFNQQSSNERRGIYTVTNRPSAGVQTVQSDSIDSLALHIAAIGLAILIGYLLKMGLACLDTIMPLCVQKLQVLKSFPLFPLCLVGGLILQKFLEKVKINHLICGDQIDRLGGASLDFLVISAMSSIRLDFVLAYWLPLLILVLCGISWSLFMVLFMGPRIFKDYWFEKSIAEFGQSTGVTATGLLLLRTVDSQNKTSAMSSFGYKQLLHEPLLGGGIITSLAVPLVISSGILPFLIFTSLVLLFWFGFYFFYLRPRNKR
jgi:ESS family glutamate:Na+ symporter